MPTSFRLTLAPRRGGVLELPAPLHLHALVSTLVAESDDAHRANEKPWSVSPPAIQNGRLHLLLNWLPDSRPPDFAPLHEGGVRLGSVHYGVAEVDMRQVPFGLMGLRAHSALDMHFQTPTWFTRGGGEYALPDPYLVFRRLADRWESTCPDSERLPGDSIRELLDGVRITRFEGRSAPFEVGHGRKTGFVGWAKYQLPKGAAAQAVSSFASLGRFAAFSGVGAMTTYGAGHVEVDVGTVAGSPVPGSFTGRRRP